MWTTRRWRRLLVFYSTHSIPYRRIFHNLRYVFIFITSSGSPGPQGTCRVLVCPPVLHGSSMYSFPWSRTDSGSEDLSSWTPFLFPSCWTSTFGSWTHLLSRLLESCTRFVTLYHPMVFLGEIVTGVSSRLPYRCTRESLGYKRPGWRKPSAVSLPSPTTDWG